MSIEENKAIVRRFLEAWNTGELDLLDDIMGEHCCLSVSLERISCNPTTTKAIATH
jgi:hypothetical protein